MKTWRMGAIVGGIWGLVSLAIYVFAHAPAQTLHFTALDIFGFPAFIVAYFIHDLKLLPERSWAILSIHVGVLLGAVIGRLIGNRGK